MKRTVFLVLAVGTVLALVAAACSKAAPTPTPTQAPVAALMSHQVGAAHPFQPKGLEAVVETDMYEFYFANPQGEKTPIFRLPAGKTVGIHIHNEGGAVHEIMIGRVLKQGGEHGYEQALTELVPSDLFFYYNPVKAEVEDTKFGELEVEPGIRDIWLRMKIPAELKGEWEIGCFVEGHYEAGMKAKLIVE